MIETSLLVNFYYYELFKSGFDLSGSEKPNFLNFFYQIAYGNGKVHPMIKVYVKTPFKRIIYGF